MSRSRSSKIDHLRTSARKRRTVLGPHPRSRRPRKIDHLAPYVRRSGFGGWWVSSPSGNRRWVGIDVAPPPANQQRRRGTRSPSAIVVYLQCRPLSRLPCRVIFRTMGRKKRGPGRPRSAENAFARWIDAKGWTREKTAERLGIKLAMVNALCRGTRRPSLELAFEIQDLTDGAVSARSWLRAPAHDGD